MSTSPDPQPLDPGALADLEGVVDVPEYDRAGLRRSIVHIGVGGFHRAHLATYVDDLARDGHTGWSIIGAGLMAGDRRMAEVLDAQEGLYCLISRGADQTDVRVVGSIVDYVLAADDPEMLISRIADPDVQIVSLTITEGGYPVDDVTGDFDPRRMSPGSAFDVLVRALDRRRLNGGTAITVMSCDNVMANGDVTRTATLGAAALVAPDLMPWLETSVSFPNSMVDRITPATSPSDVAWLAQHAGISDGWPVVAEPFRQWVVEDHFAGERLPLEQIDVIVTDDVAPFELVKLRLLNAGHSCLAYLAALAGYEDVADAMADAHLAAFVERFLRDEVKSTLPSVEGIDIDMYIDTLLVRFSNPGVGDQIARLCLDGSSKFPKFLLPTIRARLTAGDSVDHAALALAGWCEYLAGEREHAADPRLETAREFARRSVDAPGGFLAFGEVFDESLATDSPFAVPFVAALTTLRGRGVQSSIESIAPSSST